MSIGFNSDGFDKFKSEDDKVLSKTSDYAISLSMQIDKLTSIILDAGMNSKTLLNIIEVRDNLRVIRNNLK